MAKQINQSEHNGNREKINDFQNKIMMSKIIHFIAFLTIIYGAYLFLMSSTDLTISNRPYLVIGFGLILCFVGKVVEGNAKEEIPALKAGIQGEEIISNYLNELSDEYLIVNNVNLNVNGRQTEIDSLVISSYGLWIIETKNYVGYLSGNAKDDRWQRERISRYGVSRKDEVSNPLKQMHRQIYISKEFLERNHVHTFIHGLVALPSAQGVRVDSNELVLSKNDLLQTIEKERTIRLSNRDLHNILVALNLKQGKLIKKRR